MPDSLREEAARQIFHCYVERLKGLVRWQLNERFRRPEGTSAVVQEALASFFDGKPNLDDPESVWPLLATITKRKAIDVANRYTTGKRDIGREVPNSNFEDDEGSDIDIRNIDRFRSAPTADEARILIEILEFLCEEQQLLVKWRLEGYSYQDIGEMLADKANRARSFEERTIQRRFQEIRRRLETDYFAD